VQKPKPVAVRSVAPLDPDSITPGGYAAQFVQRSTSPPATPCMVCAPERRCIMHRTTPPSPVHLTDKQNRHMREIWHSVETGLQGAREAAATGGDAGCLSRTLTKGESRLRTAQVQPAGASQTADASAGQTRSMGRSKSARATSTRQGSSYHGPGRFAPRDTAPPTAALLAPAKSADSKLVSTVPQHGSLCPATLAMRGSASVMVSNALECAKL
jgi:hypothetical protein